MAVKLKIYPRKKKGGRKGGRKSIPQAVKSSPTDQATCTEIVDVPGLSPNLVYDTAFRIDAVTDAGIPDSVRFERATILASQYKFYRCSRVEYEYLPTFNTFQDGAGSTVPYLYSVMNRSGEQLPSGPIDYAFLQRQGASPIKFTKSITKAYKPNTLIGSASTHKLLPGATQSNATINWSFTPVYDVWQSTEVLKTSDEGVPASAGFGQAVLGPPTYYGHWFIIKQDIDGVPETPVGDLVIKVHWEFKEPRSLDDTRQTDMSKIASLFPTGQ